jgi:hypothetical protein
VTTLLTFFDTFCAESYASRVTDFIPSNFKEVLQDLQTVNEDDVRGVVAVMRNVGLKYDTGARLRTQSDAGCGFLNVGSSSKPSSRR